jgi:hypothetical protein
MRHVLSLLFGLLLAPLIWFLASLGHYRFLDALRRFGDDPDRLRTELAFGALLIIAAGVWLGVLLGTRLSPLGPGIAALIWLGAGAFFILDVQRVVDLLPEGPSGKEDLYVLPLDHGYAFLVGAAMLVPLFNRSRWRSRADARHPAASVSAPPASVGAATARNDRIESDPRHEAPNRYRRDTSPLLRDDPTGQREHVFREDTTGQRQRPVFREEPSGYRESPTGYATPVYREKAPPAYRENAQQYGTERRWAEPMPSEARPGEGRGGEQRPPWDEQPARRRTNDR